MIDLIGIAPAGQIQSTLSQASFNLHDCFGFRSRRFRRVPEQLEHSLHVRYVLLSQFLRLSVVFDVVVTIGQRHTTLISFGNYLGRVLEILIGGEAEQCSGPFTMQVNYFFRELLFGM